MPDAPVPAFETLRDNLPPRQVVLPAWPVYMAEDQRSTNNVHDALDALEREHERLREALADLLWLADLHAGSDETSVVIRTKARSALEGGCG